MIKCTNSPNELPSEVLLHLLHYLSKLLRVAALPPSQMFSVARELNPFHVYSKVRPIVVNGANSQKSLFRIGAWVASASYHCLEIIFLLCDVMLAL